METHRCYRINSQGDLHPVFDYVFADKPMAGDIIYLTDKELEGTELTEHKWVIEERVWQEGTLYLLIDIPSGLRLA